MDILTIVIVSLIAVIGLTLLSFAAMFLIEHINLNHQEHLEDWYDQKD